MLHWNWELISYMTLPAVIPSDSIATSFDLKFSEACCVKNYYKSETNDTKNFWIS